MQSPHTPENWSAAAAEYDDAVTDFTSLYAVDLLERLDPTGTCDSLEVAAGPGNFTVHLARRCQRVLARWWLVHKNALRVGVELSAKVLPPVYDWTKWLNDRFSKPAHPTVHTERRASR